MIFLPRVYHVSDKLKDEIVWAEREAKYLLNDTNEAQDMDVLSCKDTNRTFIKIQNNYFYREERDALEEIFRDICSEKELSNVVGHIVFKADIQELPNLCDCSDLYYLFSNITSFEEWFHKNEVSVILRLHNHEKIDVNEYKDTIFQFIRNHFHQEGNIFLLKIKLNDDDKGDFYYNVTRASIEKKKRKDDYLRAMDDEICGDVYYYHNQINDSIDLYTIGCELSEWDGEKISHMLNTEELKEEIILVNTCAVTEFAQLGSEKLADRLRKIYPNKTIYFVGCGVNYNKDYYSKLGIALTNQEKFNVSNYGIKKTKKLYNNNNFNLNQHRDVGMVKIEDGCYNNCSYCIIHKIRPHYMMPYEKIHSQIRELLSQGKKTIQLIGTEICSYKSDGLNLTTLCEKILFDFPELTGLVLGALDPASKQIDSLIELIKREKRIYNVLYLCTQSCSDEILKRMNRRHNADRLREISRLAGKDVHLVFQLILGFPGETDELFQETVNVIKELKPVDYDAIVFSPRKGTPAYDMPNRVSKEVTDRRERIIYDLIKSYTFEDDQNTNRSFAQYEQTGSNNFVKHKPDLSNSIIFYEDLYDSNAVVQLFDKLNEYKNESKDLVIITNFDLSKDLFDLDVNIKLLTSKFGVKVITKFLLNDDVMDFISHTYWIPNVIMYRIGTYMEFDFERLETTSEEDILTLFKTSYLYKIDDIEIMALKLLRAGNSKLFNSINKAFEIRI